MIKTIIAGVCILVSNAQYPECSVGISVEPPYTVEECATVATEKLGVLESSAKEHVGSTYVVKVECVDLDRNTIQGDLEDLGHRLQEEMRKKIRSERSL